MQLDYMVLADYVRQDGGSIHIMGAGVDTVAAVAVPVVQPFGIALRIRFDDTDVIGGWPTALGKATLEPARARSDGSAQSH